MSIFQPLPDEDDRSYLRLLRLQPGDYSDPIECTLEIVTHEESKDQYEAISYCWGNSNDTIPIVCNGLHVPVTRSLESAMRRFRTPSGSTARLLWADAICINQKDDEEKGKQVGRMGEVYMNASCVLVWFSTLTKPTCEVEGLSRLYRDLLSHSQSVWRRASGYKWLLCFKQIGSGACGRCRSV
jgi:hypothetical protein